MMLASFAFILILLGLSVAPAAVAAPAIVL